MMRNQIDQNTLANCTQAVRDAHARLDALCEYELQRTRAVYAGSAVLDRTISDLEHALTLARLMRGNLDPERCTCEWADDDGNLEVGPDPYIAQIDEGCPRHGRSADPEGWRLADEQDRLDAEMVAKYGVDPGEKL